MKCLNPQFIASCRSDGLDEAWLRSLSEGPKRTHGSTMTQSTIRKLSFRQVIKRAGITRTQTIIWGPGKFYQEMLEALR